MATVLPVIAQALSLNELVYWVLLENWKTENSFLIIELVVLRYRLAYLRL